MQTNHPRLGWPKYRQMQQRLDQLGYMTAIVRHGPNCYQWIVNGEIEQLKNRNACNKRLKKLLEKTLNELRPPSARRCASLRIYCVVPTSLRIA